MSISPCRLVPHRPKTVLLLAWFLIATVAAHAQEAEGGPGVVGGTLWETIERGGEVMYILLFLSVVGLALIFEVAFRTRQGAILPGAAIRAIESGERERIEELAGRPHRICIHRVLHVGLRWRHGTPQQIQAAVEESVGEMLWRLKRSARPLGILANTAPLLGLLGTVLGIIKAFDAVARQGALGDPSALADGIAEALLTTCFGLIVAIPLLLCYHFFVGKVENLLRRCEELAKEALVLPPSSDETATKSQSAPE